MKGVWSRLQHDRPIRNRRKYRSLLSAAFAIPPPSNNLTPTITAPAPSTTRPSSVFPPLILSSFATTRNGSCPERALRATPARAEIYSAHRRTSAPDLDGGGLARAADNTERHFLWFDRAAELELELIQSHMAQKPVLRGEVGARVRVIRAYGQRRERRYGSRDRSSCPPQATVISANNE